MPCTGVRQLMWSASYLICCLLPLACALLGGTAAIAGPTVIPPPEVKIAAQDGGYVVTTPVYRARVQADGNLHSLQINGIEFLDDHIAGSAGASFFSARPVALPMLALNDRTLTATDGVFTVEYLFDEGAISLALKHTNPKGAAYIAVLTGQVDYVENLVQSSLAAAPTDNEWADVAASVPTGEYLELRGGSRVWGSTLGRQVWELGNIARGTAYQLILMPGQRAPRTPDLAQLAVITPAVNATDRLVPRGQPATLQLQFDNNAGQPMTTEVALRVTSTIGKVVLDDRKPLDCPAHKSVTLEWPLTPDAADFYTATWQMNLGGTLKTQTLTFGYDVTAIAPPLQRPPDFDAYWTAVMAEVNAGAVEMTRAEVPARSSGTVTVNRIAVNTAGISCNGWLSVPKAPNRYPGLLLLPGDRVRYLSPNIPLAECGYVVMVVEPTGQAIDGTLKPKITEAAVTNLADPATFGLRQVLINYLHAVTALSTVPEVDPNRIAVLGVGLGGGLALTMSALDDRIQAVAPDVPSLCFLELGMDLPGWPYTEVTTYLKNNPKQRDGVMRTMCYFDVANLADRITCPVLISAGIEDNYSRPATIYGLFNRLRGPRALKLYPGGHEGGGLQHWEEKVRWLKKVLGEPGPQPAGAARP